MRIGTCHFVSFTSAVNYYFTNQGLKSGDVQAKLNNGEISIAAPTIKKNEKLEIDNDGRYIIITK